MVGRLQRVEQRPGGLGQRPHAAVPDAAAGVEDQQQVQRHLVVHHAIDGLWRAVVAHHEVPRFEAGHGRAAARDGDVDGHRLDRRTEHRFLRQQRRCRERADRAGGYGRQTVARSHVSPSWSNRPLRYSHHSSVTSARRRAIPAPRSHARARPGPRVPRAAPAPSTRSGDRRRYARPLRGWCARATCRPGRHRPPTRRGDTGNARSSAAWRRATARARDARRRAARAGTERGRGGCGPTPGIGRQCCGGAVFLLGAGEQTGAVAGGRGGAAIDESRAGIVDIERQRAKVVDGARRQTYAGIARTVVEREGQGDARADRIGARQEHAGGHAGPASHEIAGRAILSRLGRQDALPKPHVEQRLLGGGLDDSHRHLEVQLRGGRCRGRRLEAHPRHGRFERATVPITCQPFERAEVPVLQRRHRGVVAPCQRGGVLRGCRHRAAGEQHESHDVSRDGMAAHPGIVCRSRPRRA